ncbi:hypothetical protein C8R43DRAFT_965244 [Mycena crocata]|nr:hypothetical protein C8R43DRAFT_965244 [Mycena crocata]
MASLRLSLAHADYTEFRELIAVALTKHSSLYAAIFCLHPESRKGYGPHAGPSFHSTVLLARSPPTLSGDDEEEEPLPAVLDQTPRAGPGEMLIRLSSSSEDHDEEDEDELSPCRYKRREVWGPRIKEGGHGGLLPAFSPAVLKVPTFRCSSRLDHLIGPSGNTPMMILPLTPISSPVLIPARFSRRRPLTPRNMDDASSALEHGFGSGLLFFSPDSPPGWRPTEPGSSSAFLTQPYHVSSSPRASLASSLGQSLRF